MPEDTRQRKIVQWLGFGMGPPLALACLLLLPTSYEVPAPELDKEVASQPSEPTAETPIAAESPSTIRQEFSWAGRATLAVMVLMAVWWLTEAIDISLTALLPIVLFPLLGAADIKQATAPYANHLIYLYLGGFVIALSMERWGLGKRIALLTLRIIGTTASRMVFGFMLVTAVLSAFVSNTATTAMMLPIALSVIALLRGASSAGQEGADKSDPGVERFGTCLLLAIAYAASVGGIMTIIGTPTNAFLVGFLRDSIASEYQQDFSFAGWLPVGVSLAAMMLPIIYWLLTRVLFRIGGIQLAGGQQMIESELKQLGHVHRGEWNTLVVFVLTILAWLSRPLLAQWEWTWQGSVYQPFQGLSDTGIAMTAALALFMLPVDWRERAFTMDWKNTAKVPWGILLLFGGGLSLAAAVKANGVAEFLGSYAGNFGQLPTVLTILLVTAAIIFLTELTSNVATTTSLVPVLAALAPGVGLHPYVLIFPATLAASCAFMLPVATPPNAIVFGSGAITLPQMVRAGVWLNLISVVVVTLITMVVVRPWLGI